MWPTIDFELGIWNAWIFMLLSLLTWPLFFRLAKVRAPHPSRTGLSKPRMIFCIFSKLIFFPAVAYSFFLPLKFGTIWFYVGLPITLVGLVASVTVLVNWAGTTPGKPVTRGLYRYSRHPMYVSNSLFLLGVSIASASWVFLLFPIIMTVGAVVFIGLEEQQCLEHYGNVYREYMNRTPRWIGILKSQSLS
jgi:protein-S-isoprenylcysteine O-methyltransferase Ste14